MLIGQNPERAELKHQSRQLEHALKCATWPSSPRVKFRVPGHFIEAEGRRCSGWSNCILANSRQIQMATLDEMKIIEIDN